MEDLSCLLSTLPGDMHHVAHLMLSVGIMTARLRTQTSKSRGHPLLPVKADYILYH